MTFGKATALTAGLVGAMAFGVWIGPYLTDHAARIMDTTTAHVAQPATAVPEATNNSAAPPPRTPAVHGDLGVSNANPTKTPSTANATMIPVSAPQLHNRLKPLLHSGADMSIVSDGFRNAEDFAATVHASKNTNVPFMILKHQVVDEGKSLKTAIHVAKPDADALLEADLARAEARSDLASLN
jgi:hypothetical protein